MMIRPTLFLILTFMYASLPGAPAASEPTSFERFDQRARAGERLSVVFFGGSLTWGAQASDPQLTSYRALISQKLEEAYPKAHFRFWDAAIGGTGSQLGAFRLDRDVLARKPDLVFLDFSVNDGSANGPDPDRLASYESIVRRLVEAGIPVVQVILAVKADVLPDPRTRPLDVKHKEIAAAYHLPIADAVTLMRERVASGAATPNELWSVPPDATHPGDRGYALYAEAVWSAFEKAVSENTVCSAPGKMLNAETYMKVDRKRLATLGKLPEGWKVGKPNPSGSAFDFVMSRWLDDVIIADANEKLPSPEPLKMKVRAHNVMLFGEATPTSGKYQVVIDGKLAGTFDVGAIAKHGNLRYCEIIAQGLDAGQEHAVEIVPQLEGSQELRLESVCLSGEPALLSVE